VFYKLSRYSCSEGMERKKKKEEEINAHLIGMSLKS
jgi:hypothetical protein